MTSTTPETPAEAPTTQSVTLVFVVYNRREELRESLRRMLLESDYPGRVEITVIDNASSDGSSEMVREEFPQVKLITRSENIGAPAWNEGLQAATTDWVVILDDDCYFPPDGLRRAVVAANEHDADLVSFKVASTKDPGYVFTDKYRTGLFSFWGCCVLIRKRVIDALGGYDPQIFIWANELEFMLRFFDRGFRHLHFPEVVAQHMKAPPGPDAPEFELRGYTINQRHWGYVAAKLLRPRDAAEALAALLARALRDGVRLSPLAFRAVIPTLAGFVKGLRYREPVQNRELSRFYRRNFESFAGPWAMSRPLGELVCELPGEIVSGRRAPESRGRRADYYSERARLYPDSPAVLQF